MTIKFIVHGRVQGVGYRYYAKRSAEQLDVKGSVRNNPDGTVTVIAQGAEGQLALYEAYLFKGPSYSEIEKIDKTLQEETIKLSYSDFSVIF